MRVFNFPRLSRLLRASGADWIVGGIGAAGAGAFFEIFDLNSGQEFALARPDGPTLFMMVYCGLAGFLGVKSWRRLWRAGRTPLERVVYDQGVRGFGAFLLLISPACVIFGLQQADLPPTWQTACLELGIGLFLGFVVGLPGWLWAGYVGGKFMAGMIQTDEHASDFKDLPPAV